MATTSNNGSAVTSGASAAEAPSADYKLLISADSGYECETIGRCTPAQYGRAMAALHGKDSHDALVAALENVLARATILDPFTEKEARAALAKVKE